jgi:cell pole-organizing protein PopZ
VARIDSVATDSVRIIAVAKSFRGFAGMRQAGEPSVEEILESIKKVIARDNRAEAAQARVRREPAGSTQTAAHATLDTRHDVLDLREVAAQILGAEAALDERDDEEDEVVAESPLLPESTAASMRDSLAALAMLSEPGAQPQIVRSGETSLEGLVRDMLRPMLAEWLDKNLPPMVEKMVAGEIARIVGKKG